MIGSTGTNRIDDCKMYELTDCKELFSPVILSEVAAPRSEDTTESKDPYEHYKRAADLSRTTSPVLNP